MGKIINFPGCTYNKLEPSNNDFRSLVKSILNMFQGKFLTTEEFSKLPDVFRKYYLTAELNYITMGDEYVAQFCDTLKEVIQEVETKEK